MKSRKVCPVPPVMTHPSIQRLRVVDAPTAVGTWHPHGSAWVWVILILLNNGPKAQEEQCWQFRYVKDKPQSAFLKWKGESSWLNKERRNCVLRLLRSTVRAKQFMVVLLLQKLWCRKPRNRGGQMWTEIAFWLMELCCVGKYCTYMKTSARETLKQGTPNHLLQVRNGYTDSGIDLEFYHLPLSQEEAAWVQYSKIFWERAHWHNFNHSILLQLFYH